MDKMISGTDSGVGYGVSWIHPFRRIAFKLFLLLFILGLVITGVTIYWGYKHAKEALYENTLHHLVSIRDIKKRQIESYFEERLRDTIVLANMPHIISFMKGRKTGEILDDEHIHDFEDYFENVAGKALGEYGYYDILLVNLPLSGPR